MTQHTQGTWRLKAESNSDNPTTWSIDVKADGFASNMVAELRYCGRDDARLIAAAPKLLAALKMMVAMVARTNLSELPEVKYSCEVIAKAEGR